MNDFEFVGRAPAYETPDYSFVLDEYRRPDGAQFLLAHLTFARFTPSVFKKLLCEWRTFRERVTAPIFACPEVDDEKWHRFVTRTGWRPLMPVTCNNGAVRPLYIHRVDGLQRPVEEERVQPTLAPQLPRCQQRAIQKDPTR